MRAVAVSAVSCAVVVVTVVCEVVVLVVPVGEGNCVLRECLAAPDDSVCE